jgi:hypothetical protein
MTKKPDCYKLLLLNTVSPLTCGRDLTWQEELALQWLLSAAALWDLAQALSGLVTGFAGQVTMDRVCGFLTGTLPYPCFNTLSFKIFTPLHSFSFFSDIYLPVRNILFRHTNKMMPFESLYYLMKTRF